MPKHITGGALKLRTHRVVLPVADYISLINKGGPFEKITYFHWGMTMMNCKQVLLAINYDPSVLLSGSCAHDIVPLQLLL